MELKTIANLGRFKDIITTLLRYGFEDLVERLDIPGMKLVPKKKERERRLSTWERIRSALEDLGPTFVKFGQIMSLRPDLLPHPLIQELSKLQDEVGPENFVDIRKGIEKELSQPLDEVYSRFEEQPLAAASLSQVHRATLRDSGELVAVKVQRPQIQRKIEADLRILAAIAQRLQERLKDLRIYDLPGLVRITRRTLLRELDFSREARHMTIARLHLEETAGIYVPEVYADYCTRKLLTMEFVEGRKLNDLDPNDLQDPETIAKHGVRTVIKQILDDGFFHADPHPGNILIKDGTLLCLLDWGMVGRLSDGDRYDLIDLVNAVIERDSEKLLDVLLAITAGEEPADRRALERELLDILDTYIAVPIRDLNLGQLMLDITAILRGYQLRLPSDMALMIKALVTAEGTARQLYPQLNVVAEAEGYVKRLAMERFKPKVLWRNIRSGFSQLLNLNRELPKRLGQIVGKIERGELSIRFEHENLGGVRNTLENIFNRLTFGIIIAAMVIGSSMIITTGIGPLLFGFPALGVIGYLISALLGLWLVFSIIRTRKY